MAQFTYKEKSYVVDEHNFLMDCETWDEDFAMGMASKIGMENELTDKHWEVIYFIRNYFKENHETPLVYKTCKTNRLHLRELKELFPTGYLRGACKLAGVSYRTRYIDYMGKETPLPVNRDRFTNGAETKKSYRIDVDGFLIDSSEWDKHYAAHRAREIKNQGELKEGQWKLIHFLRDYYQQHQAVPTIYETCQINGIEIDELESLFPAGYHRGLVKIAGLRVD